jgi:hypothetical protein
MNGENPAAAPQANTARAGDNADNNKATGDERVDAVVAGLGTLRETPVEEHPEVLEEVHRRLGEILGEVDSGDDQSTAGR